MTESLVYPPSSVCLDCGAALSSSYCSECGQAARSPTQPLLAFLRESLEEVLSLEGRLLRGLRDLIGRPGYLTLEYWLGHRTRHMHPVRLFLVSGAVAYLSTLLVGGEQEGLLHAVATAVVGEDVGVGWQAIVIVVAVLLISAAAQRLVYFRTGRLYVEHVVLVLHAASFGMLLAPIEAVALRFLPPDIPGVEAMIAPAMVVYWVLSLGEVFGHSLPITLLRAGLVFILAFVLLIGSAFLAVGLEHLLQVAIAAI